MVILEESQGRCAEQRQTQRLTVRSSVLTELRPSRQRDAPPPVRVGTRLDGWGDGPLLCEV